MSQIIIYALHSGAFNAVYANIFFSLLVIVGLQGLKRRTICLNALKSLSFWILYFFGILYWILGVPNLQGMEFYLIVPLLTYLSGWVMCEISKNYEKTIINGVYAMALAYATHAFLNYIVNIGNVRWNLIDFFSGNLRAATGSGVINTLIFSSAMYIFFIESNKIVKLIGLLCFVISLLYALLLGSRTQFGILVFASIIIMIIYLREKNGGTWPIKFCFLILGIGIGIYVIYNNNIFDIRSVIEESNLMARFAGSSELQSADDYRMKSIVVGFMSAVEHPFGGLASTKYFHNMWLDIGRVSGIFPMGLMMLYSCISLYHTVVIFRDKSNDFKLRYIILSVKLGMIINLFLEPVLEGLLEYFLSYILLTSMVDYMYYTKYRFKESTCRHVINVGSEG